MYPARNFSARRRARPGPADFTFVQISDSHIGFNKPANADVNGTLQVAVEQINAAVHQPDLILHTGDLTHLAKAGEFDTLEQILKGLRQKEVFYVPGEHDITGDDGKLTRPVLHYLIPSRVASPRQDGVTVSLLFNSCSFFLLMLKSL